jgi:tRNA A37 threonylcarbamoyladenosine biosynthesis protein TsaE
MTLNTINGAVLHLEVYKEQMSQRYLFKRLDCIFKCQYLLFVQWSTQFGGNMVIQLVEVAKYKNQTK